MEIYQQQAIVQSTLSDSLKGLKGYHPVVDVIVTIIAIQGSAELIQIVKKLPNDIYEQMKRLVSLLRYVWVFLRRRVNSPSSTVESGVVKLYTPENVKNPMYQAVHYYITHKLKCRVVDVNTEFTSEFYYLEDKLSNVTQSKAARLMERPPNNLPTVVIYKDVPIEVTFSSDKLQVNNMNLQVMEVKNNLIHLKTTIPPAKKGLLKEFIKDATIEYGNYVVHRGRNRSIHSNDGKRWKVVNEARTRNMDMVILPKDMWTKLKLLLKNFKDGPEFYAKVGKTYKLNLCLYGEPGCGKSTICEMIATYFDRNILMCNVHGISNMEEFQALMSDPLVEDSIIYFTEVDTMKEFNKRDDIVQPSDESKQTTTIIVNNKEPSPGRSALSNEVRTNTWLDWLDGLGTKSGSISIMDTNKFDKLDPAFVRQGRMDMVIELKRCTNEMVRDFFNLFYADIPIPAECESYLSKIPDYQFLPARVSDTFMLHRADPLQGVSALVSEQ